MFGRSKRNREEEAILVDDVERRLSQYSVGYKLCDKENLYEPFSHAPLVQWLSDIALPMSVEMKPYRVELEYMGSNKKYRVFDISLFIDAAEEHYDGLNARLEKFMAPWLAREGIVPEGMRIDFTVETMSPAELAAIDAEDS